MPAVQAELMTTLYKTNLWEGFTTSRPDSQVAGWHGRHPILAKLVPAATPRIIVDVGVWKGQSTISLAKTLKNKKLDGCVLSVDTFLGSAEHWNAKSTEPVWAFERQFGRPDIYEQFLANVWHAELADYVIPMPQISVTAATILKRLDVRAGLVHLDASHSYADVVLDIDAWWPLLAPGGVLLGDDYNWPGVKQAADEFAAKEGLEVTTRMPKWIIRKPDGAPA